MPVTKVCLIHGAATTAAIWREVISALPATLNIRCADRASSGDLGQEISDLLEPCDGALVVGVSGGATLALELAARGAGHQAAIMHEPAVGSLLPGLLAPMAQAFADGGVPAFGAKLYGPRWNLFCAPSDLTAVGRDLAMFRAFEPRPPLGTAPILQTVGELSPPARHEAARAMYERFGIPIRTIAGAAHAVHLEQPAALADLIVETLDSLE